MHAKLTLAIRHLQAQGTVEEVQAVQGKPSGCWSNLQPVN